MEYVFVSFLILITTALLQAQNLTPNNKTTEPCQMILDNNLTAGVLRQYFRGNTSSGTVYMVYFRLKYSDGNGTVNPIDIASNDTFEPDLWVWAAGKGKNLLRLPIDHKILSLGLLTIQAANMDIVFARSTYSCLKSISSDMAIHFIGKYITENITSNETTTNVDTQSPIICRSVYAFEHSLYGKKGIGFDCCSPPTGPGMIYVCDQAYSEAYELVWYGPIVLMLFIYIVGMIHFYKLYNKSFQKVQIRRLTGIQKTVEEIKQDVFNRIVINTERWARIQTPEALISLRERCGFLDILGIGKKKHSNIVFILRVIFGLCLLISYYAIWGAFLKVYYDQLESTLKRLKDSQEVFLNVVGHIGWVFCSTNLGIFYYSIFECVYTALCPFLAFYAYFSIWFKNKASILNLDSNSAVNMKSIHCYHFCNSKFGLTLQYICVFLLLIHFIFLGGVFLSYLVYMVGLGVFANIDVVSPWLIPIALCIQFFTTAFDPAYVKYKSVKDSLFSICFDDFKNLIIKQNKEMFLPRDLIENFYIPNSRSIIYTCFLKIFWVLTFMFLLLLVVLTLQYPYNTKLTSIVPFLGVQVIFILPYLTKVMYVSYQTTPLEDSILKKDLRSYVKQYINDRPELKAAEDKQEDNKEESREPSTMESGNGYHGSGLGVDTTAFVGAAGEIVKQFKGK